MSRDHVWEVCRRQDLIDRGLLPASANERVIFLGHKVVHRYEDAHEKHPWKCVTCGAEWVGVESHTCEHPEVYRTLFRRDARWRCRACQQEWDGEDGVRCPSCATCTHIWDNVACILCGKDKDEYMSELPERQRPAKWVPGYYHALAAVKEGT